MKTKVKDRMPLSNKDIVFQYFQYIGNKDIGGILELFDYDAILYEPFSKSEGLRGRSAIEPFLKVAMMANSGLQREIKIEKQGDQDKVVALVSFERGDKVRARFTFEFADSKIKSLHIKFL